MARTRCVQFSLSRALFEDEKTQSWQRGTGEDDLGGQNSRRRPFLGAFSCWPLPQAVFGLTIGPFGIGAATASYCRSPTKGLRRDLARLCLAMPAMSVANLTCSRATLF